MASPDQPVSVSTEPLIAADPPTPVSNAAPYIPMSQRPIPASPIRVVVRFLPSLAGIAVLGMAISAYVIAIARTHVLPGRAVWWAILGVMTGALAKRKGFSFCAWSTAAPIVAIVGPPLIWRTGLIHRSFDVVPWTAVQVGGLLPLMVLAFLPFVRRDDVVIHPRTRWIGDAIVFAIGVWGWGAALVRVVTISPYYLW